MEVLLNLLSVDKVKIHGLVPDLYIGLNSVQIKRIKEANRKSYL